VTSPGDATGARDRRIVLLVGAVGAGKGTQATILSRDLGLPHVASGNLFREALRDGTPLGEEARGYMARGELVPDELTIAMVMERLARPDAAAGAILDGFPRTVGQAEALDATLAEHGEQIARVVFIEVPTEELIRRVSGRWVCPTCGTPYHVDTDPPRLAGICDRDGTPLVQRDDDRPEVVRARMEKQIPPMEAVVEHYEAAGVVTRVDGRLSIPEVSGRIREALDAGTAHSA
jgi:adenylate kinase